MSSYYDKGLLPSIAVKDVQVNCFREIYLSGKFPELTEEMLQQSIEKMGKNDKDLCLIIDDRVIIERWGHYLVYGSEYLSGLVTNLPIENSQEKYLPVLREIGKPTVLRIDLPNTTEYVSDGNLWGLIRSMITNWTYNVAHSRTKINFLDFTFSLMKSLPPEHIHSDFQPRKIRDSILEVDKIYDAETGEYEEQNVEEN